MLSVKRPWAGTDNMSYSPPPPPPTLDGRGLSCRKSPQKHILPSFILFYFIFFCTITIGYAHELLEVRMITLQHLLHLFGFLPLHSQVLPTVRKPYRRPLCLNGVFKHRGLPIVLIITAEYVVALLQ